MAFWGITFWTPVCLSISGEGMLSVKHSTVPKAVLSLLCFASCFRCSVCDYCRTIVHDRCVITSWTSRCQSKATLLVIIRSSTETASWWIQLTTARDIVHALRSLDCCLTFVWLLHCRTLRSARSPISRTPSVCRAIVTLFTSPPSRLCKVHLIKVNFVHFCIETKIMSTLFIFYQICDSIFWLALPRSAQAVLILHWPLCIFHFDLHNFVLSALYFMACFHMIGGWVSNCELIVIVFCH